MGCLISSLISTCLCSTASCCVSQTCSCFGKAFTTPAVAKSIATRVVYALQLLFFAFVAWLFNNLPHWAEGSWLVRHLPFIASCGADMNCAGTMGVYRVTAAVAAYHLMMALLFIKTESSRDIRASIQDGWWFFKFLFMVLFIVISFLIPAPAFVVYSWAALVGAALFIVVQLVLLVDLAHSLQENWVRNYEQTGSCIWSFLLLGGSIGAYVVMTVGFVLMYVYFAECQMNLILITVAVVSVCAVTLLSIFPKLQEKNPRSGLFQSAVVCGFSTYLIASAILAEPASLNCKRWNTSGSILTALLGVGFSFAAVGYNVFAAAGSSKDFGFGRRERNYERLDQQEEERESLLDAVAGAHHSEGSVEMNSSASPVLSTTTATTTTHVSNHEHQETTQAITDLADDLVAKREGRKRSNRVAEIINAHDHDDVEKALSTDDEAEAVTYSYSFFHLIFVLAVLYLAMILTNWKRVSSANDKTGGDNKVNVDYGMTAVWVKVASFGAVLVLYVWTLLAPVIFPNRQWV